MDFEEKLRISDRITSGVKIVKYGEAFYCVKDPSPFYRQLADVYYESIYDDYVSMGWPTKDEATVELRTRYVWNPSDAKRLKKIADEIDQLKLGLAGTEFKSVTRAKNIESIKGLREEEKLLAARKDAMQTHTAEYMALFAKLRFLVFHLTFDISEQRIWTSWDKFLAAEDKLVTTLIREAFLDENMTEASLREIARTDPWRSSWVASVKVGNLLSVPIAEMSDYQRVLLSWSLIYDGIFESMEPPEDEVVENDLLCDAWLANEARKRKNKAKAPAEPKGDEIFIPVESQEDAQKVYAMNDAAARQIVKERDMIVERDGVVEGHKTPDMQRKAREARMQGFISKVKNG